MSPSLLLLAGLALCAATVGLFVFRASPRITIVVWVLVLFFVPVWVGVLVGVFWAVASLMTLAAIAVNLSDVRLAPADGLVAAFALLVLALFGLEATTPASAVIALLEWIVPYIWGRLVLARVPALFVVRAVAAVATAAAVLALIEFASGTNVFVGIPGRASAEGWSELQSRAGFLRVEGAFGHSIALGAALAMSSVFVVGARWRTPLMLVSLVVIVGAIVATFSRIGIVTVFLALAMAILLLPGVSRAARWSIAGGGVAAVALIVPFLGSVLTDAGDEASGSAAYRSGLLSLLPQVQLLGSAGDWRGRAIVDGVNVGAFESIDNSLLLIALRFGWIPTLLVVAVLVMIAVGMLGRRATPASIAVVAQIPSLFAVALITQFGMLLWFLIGLAVAWRMQEEPAVPSDASALLVRPQVA